ncbi:MAG: nicotinate-nucleotide--dimethylbenzimidazole phosphoribosyltransferase [Oligoflexus sp.]
MNHFTPELPKLAHINTDLLEQIQEKIDQKTKPIGSLGYLEDLAMQVCLIQGSIQAEDLNPSFLLFAGDHGLAQAGVSPYPQQVTTQMMLNFLRGGAAINVFCKQHDVELNLVDCGILEKIDHPKIISRRLGHTTKNMLHEPAMTWEQLRRGFTNGMELAQNLHDSGVNTLGLGEMGIGNSSSACLISAKLLDRPISELICAGAGCDSKALIRKQQILEELAVKYANVSQAWEIMRTFGGFELVTALGAMFTAAQNRMLILVDGFIMSSVALLAVRLDPQIRNYMIFCHESASKGHHWILAELHARPILQLDMRLGEGSGAALALPILQSAMAFYRDMASFAEAEVSKASKEESDV